MEKNQIPTPKRWANGYEVIPDENEYAGPTLICKGPWTMSMEQRMKEYEILKYWGEDPYNLNEMPCLDDYIDPQIKEDWLKF